tara:strand:+ start:2478 stop:2723 length:246 start_codon:yes stop_codon:yes gene_type:complete
MNIYAFSGFKLIGFLHYCFFHSETRGCCLVQMDKLLKNQLVPHATKDPAAAPATIDKDRKLHTDVRSGSMAEADVWHVVKL